MISEERLEDVNDILGFCQTLSILYIEDNKDVRENTLETIETIFGISDIALNGDDGLKKFLKYYKDHSKFYDIVLTDLKLPTMSGIELSKEMLQINPNQMIIVNSAYNQVEVLTQLIDLGIYIFLPKPITFKQLFKALKKVSSHIYATRTSINNREERASLQQTIKEMEDELRDQNRFFNALAKDLLNPAKAIMKLTALTSEISTDPKEISYLNKIKNSDDYLLSMVENMINISKNRDENIFIEYIEFNLNNIFDNISIMVATKAQEKGLEVIFDIDNSVPSIVMGDPLRLNQVITILMNNAVKYTDTGDIILKVKMSPLAEGKKLLIFEVIDSGIGIKHSKQIDIFKRASQKNGLALAKQLVELMGGNIRVESRYGEGSRFVFSIVTQQPQKRSYRLPSKSLMLKKVLIVDSNPRSSFVLSQMLQYFRYESTISFNNEEAEKLFMDDNDFDIICIDRKFMSMIEDEAFMSDSKAKIVLIEDGILHQNREIHNDMEISGKIYKPFTQQMIFDMILNLFGEYRDGEYRRSITKDDILKLAGSHILVVEYDTIIQSSIREMLKDTGIKITMTNSGKEALSKSRKILDLDMILMDTYLPMQNDYKATKEIRHSSRYVDTPIVALLPNDSQLNIDYAKESGLDLYLSKPIDRYKMYKLLLDNILPKAKALRGDKDKVVTKDREIIDNGKKYYDLREADSLLCEDKELIKRFKTVAKSSDLKVEALLNVSRRNKAIEILDRVSKSAEEISAFDLYEISSNLIRLIRSNSEEVYLVLKKYRESLKNILSQIEEKSI
jgi:signal transduction histidine kinase